MTHRIPPHEIPANLVIEYQRRVGHWAAECFGPRVAVDPLERNDRFIEEALELVQATGYPAERVLALVEYVYDRPAGEVRQEVGGVMTTLAALCNAQGVDMQRAAEDELRRVWGKIPEIRAKQASKPTGSALPVAGRQTATERIAELESAVRDAASVFRQYERLHEEKNTDAGTQKARRNADYAARLESLLSNPADQAKRDSEDAANWRDRIIKRVAQDFAAATSQGVTMQGAPPETKSPEAFEKGDVVQCIDATDAIGLTRLEIYRVRDFFPEGAVFFGHIVTQSDCVAVGVKGVSGVDAWACRRFRRVEEKVV